MGTKKPKDNTKTNPDQTNKKFSKGIQILGLLMVMTLFSGIYTHGIEAPLPKWLDREIRLPDLLTPFEILQKVGYQYSQILESSQFQKKVIGMGYRYRKDPYGRKIFSMVLIFELGNPKDLNLPIFYLGVEYVPENDPIRAGKRVLKKFIVTNMIQSKYLGDVQRFFHFTEMNRLKFLPVSNSMVYTPKVHNLVRNRYFPLRNSYKETQSAETVSVVRDAIPKLKPAMMTQKEPEAKIEMRKAPIKQKYVKPISLPKEKPKHVKKKPVAPKKIFKSQVEKPKLLTSTKNKNEAPKRRFPAIQRTPKKLQKFVLKPTPKLKKGKLIEIKKTSQIRRREVKPIQRKTMPNSRMPMKKETAKPKRAVQIKPQKSISNRLENQVEQQKKNLPRNETQNDVKVEAKPIKKEKNENIKEKTTKKSNEDEEKKELIKSLKTEIANLKRTETQFKSEIKDLDEDIKKLRVKIDERIKNKGLTQNNSQQTSQERVNLDNTNDQQLLQNQLQNQ